tara:strand:+ start:324 stop:569 length:246 start_codon:yes stop_codon:yes gene_type:complete
MGDSFALILMSYIRGKIIMNKDKQNKKPTRSTTTVALHKNVLIILLEAQVAMSKELGFKPTRSQAIGFLVKMYNESNGKSS